MDVVLTTYVATGIINPESLAVTTGNQSSATSGNDTVIYASFTPYNLLHLLTTSILLGFIILLTIIGNVFVIAAILLERNLQNIQNYPVLSLAVADLMVAALVMPLALLNDVSQDWFLGAEFCDMWISFDVICCTSSILHLVCIALNRYWTVTRIEYINNQSPKRILIMICFSWIISVCISVPPLFGWKDEHHEFRTEISGDCLISQNWGYTVYSTVGAFYLPLICIVIIYLKIFWAARARIRKKHLKTYIDLASNMKPLIGSNKLNTISISKMSDSMHMSRDVGGGSADGGNGDVINGSILHSSLDKLSCSSEPSSACGSTCAIHDENNIDTSCNHGNEHGCDDAGDGCHQNHQHHEDEEQHHIQCHRLLSSNDIKQEPIPPADCLDSSSTVITIVSPDSSLRTFNNHTLQNSNKPVIQSNNPVHTAHHELMDSLSPPENTKTSSPSLKRKKNKTSNAKAKLEAKRERKAARTLAIITGTFIGCWLPFFILAIVRPFCGDNCNVDPLLSSVISWLGYCNSLLNPIIYTVFNPDFRMAFRKILFGQYQNRYRAY